MVSASSSALTSSAGPPPAAGERDYYSIAQATQLLGVSRVSIWRWIRDGRLPASRVGPRTTRIRPLDLERFMVERRTVSPWSKALGNTGTGVVIEDGAMAVPPADWGAIGSSEHFVQFYDVDDSLLDAVAGFIAAALRGGDIGIIIATTAHREGVEQRFCADGLDVAMAREAGQYVALDAADILPTFMVDGTPEPARFAQVIESVIAQAVKNGRRVRIFGEMVALLALEGNYTAAIHLEELWNDLQMRHSFALFCAYPTACLGRSELTEMLSDVCEQHGRVIPSESYTTLPTTDDRFRAIIQWQQKAQSLEAALAAEWAARQAAEDALRMREEFLSIASHELKTPLTTLSGHAQMALRRYQRDGYLEPERVVQSLETIRDQAGKLSRLINQLLDVTRLEAGKLMLERTPTDLAGLVERIASATRVVSEQHTITVEAPPSLEAWVDPLRLEQVLTNLLNNAVKYSPEGGQIEVVLVREGSDAVELGVRDHGLGIPVDKRERLFERFYQAHGNGHGGGMGLGLHISRQIVELHGGSIHAEFPPDGGTRFVVHLPTE